MNECVGNTGSCYTVMYQEYVPQAQATAAYYHVMMYSALSHGRPSVCLPVLPASAPICVVGLASFK